MDTGIASRGATPHRAAIAFAERKDTADTSRRDDDGGRRAINHRKRLLSIRYFSDFLQQLDFARRYDAPNECYLDFFDDFSQEKKEEIKKNN